MTTRMERATERIALAALRRVNAAAEPPLPLENLEKNFYAGWPTEGSRFPMTDAMRAVLKAAAADRERLPGSRDEGQANETTPMTNAWECAVAEAVEEYFETARRSFAEGNPLEGTEALTDAVRAALGYIAAKREWPHGTQTDLYDATTALATGTLPEDDDKASELLDSAPEEGIDLCSVFAASMGQPASVKFGMFYDSRDGCDADATMFARRSIELARHLAKEKAVAS